MSLGNEVVSVRLKGHRFWMNQNLKMKDGLRKRS
jgi:hypothetical protein